MRTPSFMPYAAGLAAALILSGCAAEEVSLAVPTPVTTPSSRTAEPPSTTPATTVDPVVARIPQAARADTQEGAEAFAKFFIEQVTDSFVEGDPDLLSGLFVDDCKTCINFRKTASYFESKGQHYAKRSFVTEHTSIRRFLHDDPVKFVEVAGHEIEVDIVDRTGARLESTKPNDNISFVLAIEFDEHWTVSAVHVEQR
ncbi:hypothetical protein OO014_17750 [Intrasporangium calvum]|uniref:SnoaL-like domain-containing protein n=1 Tax=Intrasporangium calvum TaxID=53358 RepID=A0ABT5GLK7_9MICO|nr:DUF6318 family protein [Intrasporangium calvum]MDC5699097.1 hypothetical protein [Intrasporangium calvum]